MSVLALLHLGFASILRLKTFCNVTVLNLHDNLAPFNLRPIQIALRGHQTDSKAGFFTPESILVLTQNHTLEAFSQIRAYIFLFASLFLQKYRNIFFSFYIFLYLFICFVVIPTRSTCILAHRLRISKASYLLFQITEALFSTFFSCIYLQLYISNLAFSHKILV